MIYYKTFQACGVVAIKSVIKNKNIYTMKKALDNYLQPLLKSRTNVRKIIKNGILRRLSLSDIWKSVENEIVLSTGSIFREVSEGRIDIDLPFELPYNDTEVIYNPLMYSILVRLLGGEFRLKFIRAVIALTESDGNGYQHWHRDTGVLFPNDMYFHDNGVHNNHHGVHLPPYAINFFINLEPLTSKNGPTEFALGSHQAGELHVWDDTMQTKYDTHRFFLPAGSVVIADYRTVHRGTINNDHAFRPLIMCVYGREWWSDVVNYGVGDYGGFNQNVELDNENNRLFSLTQHISSRPKINGTALSSPTKNQKFSMFHGLSQVWEDTLFHQAKLESQN